MKKTVLALTLLTALPFAASAAEGVSYNYVEGGYVYTDSKGGDADGWGVKGSVAVAPNFHVFGDYTNQDTKKGNVGVDQWRVGVGYNHEIATRVDLLTRIAYQKFDAGRRADWNGYSAEVGVQTAFNDIFGGYALAGYEDYSRRHGVNPDGEFYGRLGVQAKFTPNWAVSGEVKLGKAGAREWFIGPRFTW